MGLDVDGTLVKRGAKRWGLWPNGVLIYKIESNLGKLLVLTILTLFLKV